MTLKAFHSYDHHVTGHCFEHVPLPSYCFRPARTLSPESAYTEQNPLTEKNLPTQVLSEQLAALYHSVAFNLPPIQLFSVFIVFTL